MLKLVAPISMSPEAQAVWMMAAADALEDIRVEEVAAVSAEVRRSVTRASQIVPEIARLVSEKRARASRISSIADGVKYDEPPKPKPCPPFTQRELDSMPPAMISLGMKYGYLERREGRLVEIRSAA